MVWRTAASVGHEAGEGQQSVESGTVAGGRTVVALVHIRADTADRGEDHGGRSCQDKVGVGAVASRLSPCLVVEAWPCGRDEAADAETHWQAIAGRPGRVSSVLRWGRTGTAGSRRGAATGRTVVEGQEGASGGNRRTDVEVERRAVEVERRAVEEAQTYVEGNGEIREAAQETYCRILAASDDEMDLVSAQAVTSVSVVRATGINGIPSRTGRP